MQKKLESRKQKKRLMIYCLRLYIEVWWMQRRFGFGTDRFNPFARKMWNERKFVVSNSVESRELEREELHLIQYAVEEQMKEWEK